MNSSGTIIRGIVKQKKIAAGSKNEHVAIVLETGETDYVLRQAGKNPFAENELAKFVGSKMECQGTIHGQYFFVSDFKPIESD